MDGIHIRKLANAFIPDASPSRHAWWLLADARSVIGWLKRKWGGLWVGGTVTVSERGVAFSPNRVNALAHDPLQPIDVPAADIRAVRREFGWVTGIVVIEHARGELRFRCYGARKLAATIAALFTGPGQ